MTRTNGILIIKTFVAFVILLLLMTNVYPYVNMNGSGTGYESSEGTTERKSAEYNSIEQYVIDAGGYFFQAQSDILYFSNLYELSCDKVDADLWRQVLDSAVRHVQDTKMTYTRLIATAEATPYYQPVIYKLENFDYRGFGSKNNLNMDTFTDVEVYLKNGNINGVYREAMERLVKIETILSRINTSLNNGMMPELSDVWQLNEACSHKLMFGQYVAMVFINLD